MSSDEWRKPVYRADRPYARRERGDGTVGCRQCGDTNWVEVGPPDLGIPTVRPCSQCVPDAYEKWAKGEFLAKRDGYRHPRSLSTSPEPEQVQF